MENPSLENTPNKIWEIAKKLDGLIEQLPQLTKKGNNPESPINISGAAKYLGRAKDTIYKDVQNIYSCIPYHKRGGRLYFFKSELAEWIRSGNKATAESIKKELDEVLSKHGKK